MPLMQADLTREQYADCLGNLYGVVAAWEELALASAPDWLHSSLIARRRRSFLDEDLAWLGIPAPSGRARLPQLRDLPSLLGAMYVIEGSTLGGQIIARQVQQSLSLPHGHGDSFFRGHGEQTGPLWKEFCDMLTTRIHEGETDKVIASAKAMFAAFGSWMQQKPVADGS